MSTSVPTLPFAPVLAPVTPRAASGPDHPSTAPSPRLSRRAMAAVGAGSFGLNMVNAFSNAVLPLLLASSAYAFPPVLIGLLAQERSLAGAVLQPVIGALSDRTRSRWGPRKPYFILGALLTSALLGVLALHPPKLLLLCLLPFLGLALAVAADPYSALVADLAPSRERGPLGGVQAACNMAGQVALLVAAAALYVSHPVWLFAAMILGLCGSFALTCLFAPATTAAQSGTRTRVAPANGESKAPLTVRVRAYIGTLRGEKTVLAYTAALCAFWLGNGAAVPFVTTFAVRELHASTQQSFLLLLAAVATAGVLAIPAGLLGRRYGKKNVLCAALLAFALTSLVGSAAQTLGQGVLVMVALGAANAAATALIMPLLADVIPAARAGEFCGLGAGVWSLAQPLGAVLAGAAVGLTGTVRPVFIVASVLFLASWVLLRRVDIPRAGGQCGAAAVLDTHAM